MQGKKGAVIWITGLSDSGKTTLAKNLDNHLRALGLQSTRLDGDELREVFSGFHGFDQNARLRLGYSYSRLCHLLSMQGHFVIIAVIGLFHELHAWNRKNLSNYFEVYLDTPIEELRRRDSKGLYRRYDAGEVKNLYGLDMEYQAPLNPDLKIDYHAGLTPDSILNQLVCTLHVKKVIT